MPGPCSQPAGNKSRWEELNEIVCAIHYVCTMDEFNGKGQPIAHEYITYREWLARRKKLRTGKTL